MPKLITVSENLLSLKSPNSPNRPDLPYQHKKPFILDSYYTDPIGGTIARFSNAVRGSLEQLARKNWRFLSRPITQTPRRS
ncbi:hypothetical protein HYU94_03595 [Candidatus Daviesbacteria bacterium]|nr:hypothetical protein [Candidatus Daviesbacteria bacterium]